MSDYYKILGVDRTATHDEIKRAYRKLAAKHHPDRGGDTAMFQEIQAAYDVIGDPEKRNQYDNPGPQFSHSSFDGAVPPGFEDIFSAFGAPFNGMFRRPPPPPQQNQSLGVRTEITLEEAFHGKEIVVSVKLPSGKDQILEIKIPPGATDKMKLRLAGMGDDSIPHLPKGDIYLTVQIKPHARYIRENDDLIQLINVNAIDAILGTTYNIETVSGKTLEVKIPAGIQHGQILAVRGCGMPNLKNPTQIGRLLLNVNIVIPTNLTDSQKQTLKTFQLFEEINARTK